MISFVLKFTNFTLFAISKKFVKREIINGIRNFFIFRVTVPTHYGNLNATVAQILPHMSPWERFSIEFVLTFLIVFTYCVTMDGHRKWLGNSAVCMGLAYLATGLVSVSLFTCLIELLITTLPRPFTRHLFLRQMPTQNPVRAFGPAFVMNRWEHHWVCMDRHSLPELVLD